jgi:hypothetical protein
MYRTITHPGGQGQELPSLVATSYTARKRVGVREIRCKGRVVLQDLAMLAIEAVE